MALTKARSPVTDIDQMGFGTTTVVITSSGGPIDVDVAGVNILDLTSTTAIFNPVIPVTADDFNSEVVTLTTSGGAGAVLETQATLASLRTTTAHPLEIGANSITGLTVATDGKVELDVVGTATNHLVDKNYVDTLIALQTALADTTATAATNGSISIPNSTGTEIIFNWGVTASISNTQAAVTFDTAFPNAAFIGLATRQNGTASLESSAHINTLTTTGMNVVNSGGTSSPVGWIAIGY